MAYISFLEERWLRPQTRLKGLYLMGSDICTLGIGGALMGGVLSASAVLGRDIRRAIIAKAA